MSKPRRKRSRRTGVYAFLWLVATAGLLGAGVWAWDHSRRAPSVGAIVYREPGWLPAHRSSRWKCIVIHHSADEIGSAERYDEVHRKKGWDELGYHFVIGNGSESADGQVEIGPRWVEQKHGAHCKTDDGFYNDHGIGICLVGNFENHPPDEKQMRSLARLVHFLSVEFNIPLSAVYTHGGVTGRTACPGKHFDLEKLKRMVGTAQ